MTSTNQPSPLGLKLVQQLKDAIAAEKGVGRGTLSHRIPVTFPDGRAALIYTIDLTLDDDDVYLATCRELPEVFMTADSEEDVLSLARLAILEALMKRQKRPSSPA